MRVFLGVGSNLVPEENIPAALLRLHQEEALRVVQVSRFYRTPPVGNLGGSLEFLNGILVARTELGPRSLKFGVLRGVEKDLGRSPTDRVGPRTLDLDIVAHGDNVIDEPDLRVPDPDWLERPFIAVPMAEVAPDFLHPETGTLASTIADTMDSSALRYDADITNLLRRIPHPPPPHPG